MKRLASFLFFGCFSFLNLLYLFPGQEKELPVLTDESFYNEVDLIKGYKDLTPKKKRVFITKYKKLANYSYVKILVVSLISSIASLLFWFFLGVIIFYRIKSIEPQDCTLEGQGAPQYRWVKSRLFGLIKEEVTNIPISANLTMNGLFSSLIASWLFTFIGHYYLATGLISFIPIIGSFSGIVNLFAIKKLIKRRKLKEIEVIFNTLA